jgi:hypothetical protein
MFLAAVPWLPLLLAIIEFIVQKQEAKGNRSFQPIPYVVAGAGVIGMVVLAGHPELIYYTLIVAGIYSLARLVASYYRIRRWDKQEKQLSIVNENAAPLLSDGDTLAPRHSSLVMRHIKLAGWLLAMAAFGVALGAVQLIPLVELLPLNFREGSASLAQVREWAWPSRHVLTFWLPNIFGSPSHHQWFDIWSRQWIPATANALGESTHTIFWGIKNYVEGGNYLGIATWILAAVAVWNALREAWRARSQRQGNRETGRKGDEETGAPGHPFTIHHSPFTIHYSFFSTWFFLALAIISLLFAFGTPLYALLYYGLPGWNQLHSPFRWVFPFTLSMAVLGGIGLEWVMSGVGTGDRRSEIGDWEPYQVSSLRSPISSLWSLLSGLFILLIVSVSIFYPAPFIAFGQRVVDGSDLARMAFADGRMFWSYQAANLAQLGSVLVGVGLLLWWLARRRKLSIVNSQLSMVNEETPR